MPESRPHMLNYFLQECLQTGKLRRPNTVSPASPWPRVSFAVLCLRILSSPCERFCAASSVPRPGPRTPPPATHQHALPPADEHVDVLQQRPGALGARLPPANGGAGQLDGIRVAGGRAGEAQGHLGSGGAGAAGGRERMTGASKHSGHGRGGVDVGAWTALITWVRAAYLQANPPFAERCGEASRMQLVLNQGQHRERQHCLTATCLGLRSPTRTLRASPAPVAAAAAGTTVCLALSFSSILALDWAWEACGVGEARRGIAAGRGGAVRSGRFRQEARARHGGEGPVRAYPEGMGPVAHVSSTPQSQQTAEHPSPNPSPIRRTSGPLLHLQLLLLLALPLALSP